MWIPKRAMVAALSTALTLALAVGALGHRGHHGNADALLDASLAPSLPSDPTFHGVAPGAAPWVLKRGEVRIERRGRFELRVRGLVIPNPPGDGTAGPVKTVSASLYCGADSGATAADTTGQAPISASGNARVRDRSFDVPDDCLAPVVLLHPNGDVTHYIAVTGWRK